MNPSLLIVTTTYFPPDERDIPRRKTAIEALSSWKHNLLYDGKQGLHISDDGSKLTPIGIDALRGAWWHHPEVDLQFSQGQRQGVGASLNRAFQLGFENGYDVILYLVDDWKLMQPFDISPWVDLLAREPGLGMIRLGPAHPDLTGTVRHDPETGEFYLVLDRHHFAFGHRPALYHRRFLDVYGLFAEGVNAFECERLYAEHYASSQGPDISLALPHPWRHISDIELADIEPEGASVV